MRTLFLSLSFIVITSIPAFADDDRISSHDYYNNLITKSQSDYLDQDYNDNNQNYFYETNKQPEDRYKKLKKSNFSGQLDSWNRDGGQTMSSEKVLQNLMRPAH